MQLIYNNYVRKYIIKIIQCIKTHTMIVIIIKAIILIVCNLLMPISLIVEFLPFLQDSIDIRILFNKMDNTMEVDTTPKASTRNLEPNSSPIITNTPSVLTKVEIDFVLKHKIKEHMFYLPELLLFQLKDPVKLFLISHSSNYNAIKGVVHGNTYSLLYNNFLNQFKYLIDNPHLWKDWDDLKFLMDTFRRPIFIELFNSSKLYVNWQGFKPDYVKLIELMNNFKLEAYNQASSEVIQAYQLHIYGAISNNLITTFMEYNNKEFTSDLSLMLCNTSEKTVTLFNPNRLIEFDHVTSLIFKLTETLDRKPVWFEIILLNNKFVVCDSYGLTSGEKKAFNSLFNNEPYSIGLSARLIIRDYLLNSDTHIGYMRRYFSSTNLKQIVRKLTVIDLSNDTTIGKIYSEDIERREKIWARDKSIEKKYWPVVRVTPQERDLNKFLQTISKSNEYNQKYIPYILPPRDNDPMVNAFREKKAINWNSTNQFTSVNYFNFVSIGKTTFVQFCKNRLILIILIYIGYLLGDQCFTIDYSLLFNYF